MFYFYILPTSKRIWGHSADYGFMIKFPLKANWFIKPEEIEESRICLSLNTDGSLLIVSSLNLGMMLRRCSVIVWL